MPPPGNHPDLDRRLGAHQPTAQRWSPARWNCAARARDVAPGLRRRTAARGLQHRNPGTLRGPKAPVGHRSPAGRFDRARQALHRLRHVCGLVRSPPHRPLAGQRAHRHRQPRSGLPGLPPRHPRPQMASQQRPRHREIQACPNPRSRPISPEPAWKIANGNRWEDVKAHNKWAPAFQAPTRFR